MREIYQLIMAMRAATVVVVLLFAGCGRSSSPAELVEPEVQASESSIFLVIGESRGLSVATRPANSPFDAITDDATVATVERTSTGITVTGEGVGFATVVLNLTEHPGISFEIAVEVTAE